MARRVFHVTHSNPEGSWIIKEQNDDKVLAKYPTKDEAVKTARSEAQAAEQRGLLVQVVVHREDGSFETEWTYGDDPRSSPG